MCMGRWWERVPGMVREAPLGRSVTHRHPNSEALSPFLVSAQLRDENRDRVSHCSEKEGH